MVLLQTHKNRYFLTVPLEKVKRAKLQTGEEFDVDVTSGGNLIYIETFLNA